MSHPSVHFIIFGILIVFDAISNYIMHPLSSKISYIAHLGGVVVGMPMGVIILRNLKVTRMENIVWYISIVILCALGIGFGIAHIVIDMEDN